MFSKKRRQPYRKSFLGEKVKDSRLPPEVEEGNVEYKLKLVDPPPQRLQHLITQMKWRLAEGHGEAIYEIGVSDKGRLVGLTQEEMEASLHTLRSMGKALLADVSVVRERIITDESGISRKVAEVLVRKCLSDHQHFLEIRVAVVGAVDAGKSTFIGVLTHSELDNGRGRSRLTSLRHRHEIESGRTSSISHQIIGFNQSGDLVNFSSTNVQSWEQICETASKVVNFLDTCGHPKYQHTTLRGLTGHAPDYACLVVNGALGHLPETSKEHMRISIAIKVPIFIVMTKIDAASQDDLTGTLADLMNFLKSPGVSLTPSIMEGADDVMSCMSGLLAFHVVPIFLTSSVTGENLDLLTTFFNVLPKSKGADDEEMSQETEFQVDDIYTVPDVGTVVGGLLQSGQINISTWAGQQQVYYLGPDHGRFIPVKIHSIHRQRCPVPSLLTGQAGTLAVKVVETDKDGVVISTSCSSPDRLSDASYTQPPCPDSASLASGFCFRKGQVLLSYPPSTSQFAYGVWEFEAELHALSTQDLLRAHMQGVVYCGSIRQAAKVVGISPLLSKEALNEPGALHSSQSSLFDGGFASSLFHQDEDEEDNEVSYAHKKSRHSRSFQKGVSAAGMQSGRVRIRFSNEREWVKVGSTCLFRSGPGKCVGKIVMLYG